MKRILLSGIFGAVALLPTFARDFKYTYEGQTLTYTVISEQDKTVSTKIGSLSGPGNRVSGDLIIPSTVEDDSGEIFTVTLIGARSFMDNDELRAVTIPESVTEIDTRAFSMSSLTSVTIPNSVARIGDYAFSWCKNLGEVTIPESVISIMPSTFSSCEALTSVVIPESVTLISTHAFDGCKSLPAITIPESVTRIGEYAFSGCFDLTSVTIPASVTSIDDYVFINSGVKEFSIADGSEILKFGKHVFMNVDLETVYLGRNFTYTGNNTYYDQPFNNHKTLKYLTIGDSVTEIGSYAFDKCEGLTSVVIGNSVNSVGQLAFRDCTSLTKAEFASVESMCVIRYSGVEANPLYYAHNLWIDGKEIKELLIPESVTSIPARAFENAQNLTSVSLPASLTGIGFEAFWGCNQLTSVYYAAEDPNSFSAGTFGNDVYMNATLYVPEVAIEKCRTIDPWMKFQNILPNIDTGVEAIKAEVDLSAPYKVYDLSGHKMGEGLDGLSPGIYLIRQGDTVKKVIIGK